MLLSLDEAGAVALSHESEADIRRLEPWKEVWVDTVSNAYLEGYLATAHEAPFLPASPVHGRALLECFLLEIALQHLGYTLANQAESAANPLKAVLRTLSNTDRILGKWQPAAIFRGESTGMKHESKITRDRMVELLNEDLAREYQAIIAYTVYSQTMKGAAFTDIAGELAIHAAEELDHAIQITKQIDYFNGKPTTIPKEVKTSEDAEDMLRFDLENEKETIINYRARIRQAEELGEFALSEVLRKIIAQEQEHLTDLADALGIDNPSFSE